MEIVADLEKEQGRGLNGIEKEPTTVDLHAGARKAIMVDEPRASAAIEENLQAQHVQPQEEREFSI